MLSQVTKRGIFAALPMILFFACAQPTVSPGPGGGTSSSSSSGNAFTGPCAVTTPDTDSDGLSDECEISLGMDPNKKDTDGDGEEDKNDCPPNDPQCLTVPAARKNDAANGLLNPYLLAAGGMTGIPSPGTTTTITQHEIRISSGSAALPAEALLCPFTTYVYLKISGKINTCELLPETCARGDQDTALELCADTSSKITQSALEQLDTDEATLSLSDLRWAKGRADGVELFNPALLNGDQTQGFFKLDIEITQVGNVPGCVTKLNTDWESSVKIQSTIDGKNVDVEVPRINKRWERYNGFDCDETQLKGITGPWKVRQIL